LRCRRLPDVHVTFRKAFDFDFDFIDFCALFFMHST
jgi:hypothetical protein